MGGEARVDSQTHTSLASPYIHTTPHTPDHITYLEGAFGKVEGPRGAKPPAVGDLEVAHQEAVLFMWLVCTRG